MKKYVTTIMFALVCQCAFGQLEGEWPAGGGNITITTTEGPIQASGLEFVAEPGILTQGTSPAPFAFFIPNRGAPGNVTLGVLGTPVTLDGQIELDVAVSASAVGSDVTGTWGDGVVPTAFCVSCSPEPAGFSLAAFGVIALLGMRVHRK